MVGFEPGVMDDGMNLGCGREWVTIDEEQVLRGG